MKPKPIYQWIVPLLFILSLILLPVHAQESAPVDTDNDGLPDVWETTYFKGDLTAMDKDSDFDGDGISNGVEYEMGTDPTAPSPTGPRIEYQYDKLGRIIHIKRIPSATP